MKCQKCNAENINEAVKCGICGTRLKHTQTHNDFTGSTQVQSSVRRDATKKETFNPNPNIKPQQTTQSNQSHTSITDTILDKNIKVEDKARILLDSWQEKAKDAWENSQNQPKKKNFKIVWILLAVFMFGPAVLGVIASVVIPAIVSVIGHSSGEESTESVPAEDAVATDVAVDASGSEYDQRYAEMQSYQQNVERVYEETHVLPKNLAEIEKFDDVQFDHSIHEVIEVRNGIIIGKFTEYPDQLIYLEPEIKNKKIISWTCYKVGIFDGEMPDCESAPTVPSSI